MTADTTPTTTTTSEARGGTTAPTFNPRPFLRNLGGKASLEVVPRPQWLRAEPPAALIPPRLEHFDWEAGWFIFHARVEIPGLGVAEGTGSETRQNFPEGPCEKAETIAIGRALAALGYGTAFCLDFETADETGNGHLADAPVRTPGTNGANGNGAAPLPRCLQPTTNGNGLCSPAQLKLIYLCGTRDAHLTEEEMEEDCHGRYGGLPVNLTRAQASEFIDSLKARARRAG